MGVQEQSVLGLTAKMLIGSAPPIRGFSTLCALEMTIVRLFVTLTCSSSDVGYLKLTKSENCNGIAHKPYRTRDRPTL